MYGFKRKGSGVYDISLLTTITRTGRGWKSGLETDGGARVGVFRSDSCLQACGQVVAVFTDVNKNELCGQCKGLSKNESFRRYIKKFQGGSTPVDQQKKTNHLALKLKRAQTGRWKAEKKLQRLLTEMQDKVIDACKRGDFREVAHRLRDVELTTNTGGDTNEHLAGLDTRRNFACDILKNLLNASKRRNTYSKSTNSLACIIRLMGGPKLYNILAKNMSLPHIRSIDKSRARIWREAGNIFMHGLQEQNFQMVAEMYRVHMSQAGLVPGETKILVMLAEDETSIKIKGEWCPKGDVLVGYCGQHCTNRCESVQRCRRSRCCDIVHQCSEQNELIVADNYQTMVDAEKNHRKATMLRVIVANPLHPDFPRLVLLAEGTCNAFTACGKVRQQWTAAEEFCERFLEGVIGPTVGHSSDGDSRRRKEFKRLALSGNGNRYKLDHPSLTVSASRVVGPGGQSRVQHLCDMDYIHNGKKFINCLDHSARDLRMGKRSVHMHDIKWIYDNCSVHHHNLRQQDLSRAKSQAMDWPSAERVMSSKFLSVLDEAVEGSNIHIEPNECLEGLRAFCGLGRDYTSIFQSQTLPLLDRVALCGKVMTFLRLWRLWVKHEPHLTTKSNFLTRETFQDLLLSCQFVILLIMAHRDLTPEMQVHLERTGSDCCEDLFSALGAMVRNKRIYSVLEAIQSIHNQNVLHAYLCESDMVSPMLNKRRKSTWDDILPRGNAGPDMRAGGITDEQLRAELNRGIAAARAAIIALGMKPRPSGRRGGAVYPDWWTHPEKYDGWKHDRDDVDNMDENKNDDNDNDDDSSDEEDLRDTDDEEDEGDESEGAEDEGDDSDGRSNDDSNRDDDNDDASCLSALSTVAEVAVVAAGSEVPHKVNAYVRVPGVGLVHKAKVMQCFYTGATVSADRYQRYLAMSAGNDMHREEDVALNLRTDKWSVGVHDVVAVKMTDGIWPGRIKRIRRTLRNGRKIEYNNPIDIPHVHWEEFDISVQCEWFKKACRTGRHGANVPRDGHWFKHGHADPQWYKAYYIVNPVSLKYNTDHRLYEMDADSYSIMQQSASGRQEWVVPEIH